MKSVQWDRRRYPASAGTHGDDGPWWVLAGLGVCPSWPPPTVSESHLVDSRRMTKLWMWMWLWMCHSQGGGSNSWQSPPMPPKSQRRVVGVNLCQRDTAAIHRRRHHCHRRQRLPPRNRCHWCVVCHVLSHLPHCHCRLRHSLLFHLCTLFPHPMRYHLGRSSTCVCVCCVCIYIYIYLSG